MSVLGGELQAMSSRTVAVMARNNFVVILFSDLDVAYRILSTFLSI